jgi:hypothetical protein
MAALPLIEQVRLNVGDNSIDFQILTDDTYQFLLDKYTNNVNRSSLDAARYIMFELTKFPTRERTGQIEVWNEWVNAYRKALELFIKDPNLSLGVLMPYAGGISKEDMYQNDANNDNVRPQVYSGFARGVRVYNTDNSTTDQSLDLATQLKLRN